MYLSASAVALSTSISIYSISIIRIQNVDKTQRNNTGKGEISAVTWRAPSSVAHTCLSILGDAITNVLLYLVNNFRSAVRPVSGSKNHKSGTRHAFVKPLEQPTATRHLHPSSKANC